MLDILQDIEKQSASWNDMRKAFGNFLGIKDPVPSAVLNRARQDDKFTIYLIRSCHNETLLQLLFDAEANKKFEPSSLEVVEFSNTELVSKASKAMFTWAKTGFRKIDEATFEKRINACHACEHLVTHPDQLSYKVALIKRSDPRICELCGCIASRKARVISESCPLPNPNDSSKNRWGEALQSGATT